jgi:hypothetical protein
MWSSRPRHYSRCHVAIAMLRPQPVRGLRRHPHAPSADTASRGVAAPASRGQATLGSGLLAPSRGFAMSTGRSSGRRSSWALAATMTRRGARRLWAPSGRRGLADCLRETRPRFVLSRPPLTIPVSAGRTSGQGGSLGGASPSPLMRGSSRPLADLGHPSGRDHDQVALHTARVMEQTEVRDLARDVPDGQGESLAGVGQEPGVEHGGRVQRLTDIG